MATIKSLTSAQIEAAKAHKQEKAIRSDVCKIDTVLQNADPTEIESLHKQLDGKYQCVIADWGKSMYGYSAGHGFDYEVLGTDSLQDNLAMMRPKLEALMLGWNTTAPSTKPASTRIPDVNVTVNNNVTVNITFEQVCAQIEDMDSLTDAQTKEALEKVSEIKKVIESAESKKTKWEKIKPVLIWLAEKSYDLGKAILPLLLKIQE